MKPGKHTAAEDIGRVSAEVAADLFGVSRVTFSSWASNGVIERQSPAEGYDLRVICRAVLGHYRRVAAGRGGEGADALTEERVKLTRIKRRREELQAGIEAGQWARLATVRRFLEDKLLALRDRLLGLPGEAAHALAMRSQQECFEILDSFVRDKLDELADPAGIAARVAAEGVETTNETTNGEAHRSDEHDSKDENYAADPG
jgi:phage terminase Nu1 subunit (DNA packaging protein)